MATPYSLISNINEGYIYIYINNIYLRGMLKLLDTYSITKFSDWYVDKMNDNFKNK